MPGPMATLAFDAPTLTALVNNLLAQSEKAAVRSVAVERVAEKVRLTLAGVRTGLSVFGMVVPPIDADLVMAGTWNDGRLLLIWELEAVRGIPPMAAKLVGKPTLAKLLVDALGGRWGLDKALVVDSAGNLLLDPAQVAIPGWNGLRIGSLALPDGDAYVVRADFSWC